MIVEAHLQIWIPWHSTNLQGIIGALDPAFLRAMMGGRGAGWDQALQVVKPGAGVMGTHCAASKENCNYSSSESTFSWNGPKSSIISYCIRHIISDCSSVGKQCNMEKDRWCWVFPLSACRHKTWRKAYFLILTSSPYLFKIGSNP